jgi:hypothetical protein
MTTYPKEFNTLLYETIKTIVVEKTHVDLRAIKELLDSGANPKAKSKKANLSAYDIVSQHNQDGKYNALIEIFDEHLSENPREMDSVEEGMHLKSEE